MSLKDVKGKPKFSPVRDVLAGAIMAGTSVPQLVAYAEVLPYAGYRGLSTAGPNLFAWGLTTGSPWMNCGVTSLSALMTKADLDGDSYVAEYGEEAYVDLVSAYSLYVALASVFLAVAGFGKLAKRVPKPVRAGFKWGCAMGVVVAAIPNGLLLRGSSSLSKIVSESSHLSNFLNWMKTNFPVGLSSLSLTKVAYVILHPQYWALVPSTIFFFCTGFVMNRNRILPKWLPPGAEVIIVTFGATVFAVYSDYNGAVVGEIPTMDADAGISLFGGKFWLPVEILDYKKLLFDVPILDRFSGSWLMLFTSACVFAAINFLSIMGIASGFETENGIPWSASRELVAQGVACGVAGLTGSAPVSGSLSRSLVSRMAGTTSQMACLVTATCWIFCLPYMSVMSPTPKAALSAVIVSAVIQGVARPKELLSLKSVDVVEGWGTAIATALTSPTIGFGFGIVLSLVLGLFRETDDAKKRKMR